ncbi:hypothetical protein F2Q69_00050213 [Brassica cretica]|uniref:Uncharacterized protein n=1 Tax=Brassica cretica TaxID=69181 RepID=A0A8S9PQI9_BRACR|nr:hypothetical protein F2Q69_00050213 [Brassica cretica]
MVGSVNYCVRFCEKKNHSRPKARRKKTRARDEKAISLRRRSSSPVIFKGQRTMAQDYSYTQPSSSDEFEADLYADEGESSYTVAEADQYSLEPEADEGIPRTCYCSSEPVVATS